MSRTAWNRIPYVVFSALIALSGATTAAARERGERERDFDPTTWITVRAIQELDLDAETAGRFAALMNEMSESRKNARRVRREIIDALEDALENEAGGAEINALLDRLNESERTAFEEKREVQKRMRDLLGAEKAARAFLVVQDALKQAFRRHRRGEVASRKV